MARLMRIHFASIGYPDARLDRVTIDLRARDATGTGTDTVLWLRNGGGKSSILNLFYSLFRPARREFLGASAEGRARRIEDYVKANDLAFVVTEWDVDPVSDQMLFAQPPARTRIVGQVLSWRDRQRSSDPSRLRKCYFSMVSDATLPFESLPIDGLGDEPVRSFDAFREWLDGLKQARPELEPFRDESLRKWAEHLERIGLDPELFRYQLKMNEREGSADEAFRFRTTEEFVQFYLEMAFDSDEADQVSANLQGFRDKLARLPSLRGERAFLDEARAHLGNLVHAVEQVESAGAEESRQRSAAATVARALEVRQRQQRALAAEAEAAREAAREDARRASNDAARLGRWANGLDRRALELDIAEAEERKRVATRRHQAAERGVAVAKAAVARDGRLVLQADRDAKATALEMAEAEQEPLRHKVARAGKTLRVRLQQAADERDEAARGFAATKVERDRDRERCAEAHRRMVKEDAALEQESKEIDAWLASREKDRERLRSRGTLELREEVHQALDRWRAAAQRAGQDAERHAAEREAATEQAEEQTGLAQACASDLASLAIAIGEWRPRLDEARNQRSALQSLDVLQEIEGVEQPDVESPGLADRLLREADATHRRLLTEAVQGADDERALTALELTGRLPPTGEVEGALTVLKSGGIPAWSGTEYLAANVAPPQREELVRRDPAGRHGIVVPDDATLEKAAEFLSTTPMRYPLVISTPALDAGPQRPGRHTIPGHPAHWDERQGDALKVELNRRRSRRETERTSLNSRERALREAARDLTRWRENWGEGRLSSAESDQEQRLQSKTQKLAAKQAFEDAATALHERADAAHRSQLASEEAGRDAERHVETLSDFVERIEALVDGKRDRRQEATTRRGQIRAELEELVQEQKQLEGAWIKARDAEKETREQARALLIERDEVDHTDELAPEENDLDQARAAWKTWSEKWNHAISDNQLRWELERLERELTDALLKERDLSVGLESEVAEVTTGMGRTVLADAEPALQSANNERIAAELEETRCKKALKEAAHRRRENDDLPSGEPEPKNAEEARNRAQLCRQERDAANVRSQHAKDRAAQLRAEHQDATGEAKACHLHVQRLEDVLGEIPGADIADLPDDSDAVDHLVSECVQSLTTAQRARSEATRRAEVHGEALREVALSQTHEEHRSRVKERLKAPASDLAVAAKELQADVEDRLGVVRAEIEDIDQDRKLVLQQLDKVAMDGVRLLQAAERASRLPAGLGVWEGEPFLRIRTEVPGGQLERQARLAPLLDRLVAKAMVPSGRELVDAAVRELAGHRIDATLLKPDALLRRDRLPVTEMQTFSRGQQLTVAILLYCTMARLRAQQRGHGNRPDAGVLLLDNPVGTCSSVALLDIQREVARQMRVQLVYTTGVNDLNAVATFPNTVRLRNAHRGRLTGDLHVTLDESDVDAVRIVATT